MRSEIFITCVLCIGLTASVLATSAALCSASDSLGFSRSHASCMDGIGFKGMNREQGR